MEESPLMVPATAPAVGGGTLATPVIHLPRWAALVEAIIVCGIPTQVLVTLVLVFGAGIPLFDGNGRITLEFFSILSLIDTALVMVLIRVFLFLSGENPSDVFIGARSVRGEILRGLALVPVVIVAVSAIVFGLRAVAPWLQTVKTNPLEAFMQTPIEAGVFMFVAVLAGGVREEIQRGFILHRFRQRLGGVRVGLLVFSVTFGLLHVDQGVDVAIAIGFLGLVWGILYIRRRSVVLPMVNHASFNALQVLQVTLARTLGG